MIKHITGEQDKKQYEEFVGGHPKGHFVKSLKWAEFKKPWKTEVFVSADESGKIRGSMLIMISRVPKTRYTHMYCPRGPVVDDGDSDTLSELSAEARRLAEKYNAYELAIDPDITERDEDYLNLLKSAGFAINNTKYRPEYLQARYVYRLYLGGLDEESVFANFHSKTRYNIRLASKKGVNCRIGGREDLPAFHEIMKETAARDGFLARSLKYFEDMYDALAPENLRLYLAEFEGTPLAGAIAIYYGDKVWYLYGASSNSERNRMPNYLMQWEMIRWAIELGCGIYDFRGVTGDMEKTVLEGLIRFKSGFDASPADFVGRLSMVFRPRAARYIESAQSFYRALIRKFQILKTGRT
ncbi:MAG: peptidoglycan bridge formation glycyltransferase FemA/FemB family protein [Clostridiales bacterium]|nr:peptidoglycan bridge formation glycyltransferase FemA/FemB family protein [Clostridiales bacterium]